MKRMYLWIGSSPWLLISSHFVHAWVHIHTTQLILFIFLSMVMITHSHYITFTPTVCSVLHDDTSTCIYYFQAMECHIAGVVPVTGNWSGECRISVKQLLAGKIVTVRLVESLENGRIHAVDILLSMGRLSWVGNAEKHVYDGKCVICDRNTILVSFIQIKDLPKFEAIKTILYLSFRKEVEHFPPWARLCSRRNSQRNTNSAKNK